MKGLFILLALFLVTGCVAVATPEGTYIEPLPLAVTIGPPVVAVGPAPGIYERLRPLPPAYIVPDRYIYSYGGLYYYYWGNAWYYGPGSGGPWYTLPRNYYPPKFYKGPKQVPRGRPFR